MNAKSEVMNRVQDVRDMVEVGKRALCRSESSEHVGRYRKQMSRCAGSSLAAMLFGGVAMVCLMKALDSAKKHRSWEENDRKLDEALEGSFDGSDATASY